MIDKIKDVKNDEAQTTRNRIVYVTTILLVLSFAVTSLMSVFSMQIKRKKFEEFIDRQSAI